MKRIKIKVLYSSTNRRSKVIQHSSAVVVNNLAEFKHLSCVIIADIAYHD